jgi:hypothetical protein
MSRWINELRDSVKIVSRKKTSEKLIAICEALHMLDESQFNIQHYKNRKDGVVTYCPIGWTVKQIPSLGMRFVEKGEFEGSYTVRDYDGRTGLEAVVHALGISLFDYVETFSEYSYNSKRSSSINHRACPTKLEVMARIFNLANTYKTYENEED